MEMRSITRDQIILVMSVFALLIAAHYFDIWQDWLKENAASTFELQYYFQIRLWSVPVLTFLVAVGWLVVFRFMIAQKNKIIAALFLGMGICILFYPPIGMTFYITSKVGISMNYFGDSMLFYSGALVAAMGLMGLLASDG